jgi:hypothetical protein
LDAVRSLAAVFVALGLAAVVACSSSSSTPAATPDAGDDTPPPPPGPDPSKSFCGHPGDKGNSLGVGHYCVTSADCSDNTRATLCATAGDEGAFFCTFVCHQDGPPDQCGEDAECTCQGPCGCFPKACDDRPDAGGDASTDSPADAPEDG